MQTEPTGAGRNAPERLLAGWSSAQRWFVRQGPAGRIAWSIVVMAALVAVGYFSLQPAAVDLEPLYGGRRFPTGEAAELSSFLLEAAIEVQTVDGRVLVPRLSHTQAYEAIRKAGHSPSSLKDLVNEVPDSSFLSSSSELQQRENRRRERLVEGAIEEIDRSLSAVVQIFRSPPRGLKREAPVRVTVWLKLGEQPRVSLGTIERIRWAVQAWVPDLPEEGLTLLDSTGRPYLLAGNPAVAERSALAAREEELRDSILRQLDWIDGVRVAVSLDHAAEPEAALPEVEAVQAVASTSPIARPPQPVISVNQPFEEDGDEAGQDTAQAAASTATETATANAPAVEPLPLPVMSTAGQARVLIQVPNTYYTQLATASGRTPSFEGLQALVRETETSIRSSVEIVIPEAQRGEILVERIYVPTPAPVQSREPVIRDWSRWYRAASGTSIALLFLGLSVAGVVLATTHRQRRREARRYRRLARAPLLNNGRHRVDLADSPAPSERVRELVRLDPAAAAGVLQRWIGAGGQEA